MVKTGESKMRKISIIIPCYNVSRYLDRCLDSIVMQSIGMEALEIIFIDGRYMGASSEMGEAFSG